MHCNILVKICQFWCSTYSPEIDLNEFLTLEINIFRLGTDFSSIIRDGKLLRPENALDQESPWKSKDGSLSVPR